MGVRSCDKAAPDKALPKGEIIMSKTMKNISVITGVLLAICVPANIAALIVTALKQPLSAAQYLASVTVIAVACFGAVYVFSGAKKSAGKLLRLYFGVSTASSVFLLAVPAVSGSTVAKLCLLVWIGGYLILAIANDLGEKKSKIIALVIILAQVFQPVYWLATGEMSALIGVDVLTRLIVSISVYVLLCAKYADKKARGRAV